MKGLSYIILEAGTVQLLESAVRDHIAAGWQLHGGPFTYSWAPGHGAITSGPPGNPGSNFDGWIFVAFCQAMTREEAKRG